MPACSPEINVRVNAARKSHNCSIAHWLHKYRGHSTDAVASAVNAGMDSDLQGSEASLPGYLRVKPHAGVDTHGRGVFAGISIAGHMPIIMCTGRIEQRNPSKDGRYSFEMDEAGQAYVGLDLNTSVGGNLTKYINSSVGTGKQPNCHVYWQGPLAIVCSVRGIKKGEELLLEYHWNSEPPQGARGAAATSVGAAHEGNASNTPGRVTRSRRRQEPMPSDSSGSDTSAAAASQQAAAAPLTPEGISAVHAATEGTNPSSVKRRRTTQQSPPVTKNDGKANAAAAATAAGKAAGGPQLRQRHKQ